MTQNVKTPLLSKVLAKVAQEVDWRGQPLDSDFSRAGELEDQRHLMNRTFGTGKDKFVPKNPYEFAKSRMDYRGKNAPGQAAFEQGQMEAERPDFDAAAGEARDIAEDRGGLLGELRAQQSEKNAPYEAEQATGRASSEAAAKAIGNLDRSGRSAIFGGHQDTDAQPVQTGMMDREPKIRAHMEAEKQRVDADVAKAKWLQKQLEGKQQQEAAVNARRFKSHSQYMGNVRALQNELNDLWDKRDPGSVARSADIRAMLSDIGNRAPLGPSDREIARNDRLHPKITSPSEPNWLDKAKGYMDQAGEWLDKPGVTGWTLGGSKPISRGAEMGIGSAGVLGAVLLYNMLKSKKKKPVPA